MSARTIKSKKKKSALKALLSSPPLPATPPSLRAAPTVSLPTPPTTPTSPSFTFSRSGASGAPPSKNPSSTSTTTLTFTYKIPSLKVPLPIESLLNGPVKTCLKAQTTLTPGFTAQVLVAGLTVNVTLTTIVSHTPTSPSVPSSPSSPSSPSVEAITDSLGSLSLESLALNPSSLAVLSLDFSPASDDTNSELATNPSPNPSPNFTFFGYESLLASLATLISNTSDGILLAGPSGIGKTSLLKHLYRDIPHVYLDCTTLISPTIGYAERTLSSLLANPLPVILDNLNIVGKTRAKSPLTRAITSTLLAVLDAPSSAADGSSVRPLVIGLTPSLKELDVALRRPGRFSHELVMNAPDTDDRTSIVTGALRMFSSAATTKVDTSQINISSLVSSTRGYVASDVISCIRATMADHILTSPHSPLTTTALLTTLSATPPSSLKDLSVTIPSLPWSSIGGMTATKQSLQSTITHTLTHPDVYAKYNVTPPNGILLYGPPGCSKTLMAKALCSETSMNFIAVKGPELLSKYLGQSETKLANIFIKARQASPCVVFFDEVDSIAATRGASGGASDRLLAQLLTELDGVRGRDPLRRVVVVAATNRPDLIDPALVRPGRIDRMVYVSPPDAESRVQIWKIGMAKKVVDEGVDWDELGRLSEGYSGAEIVGCCRDAAIRCIVEGRDVISMDNCVQALRGVDKMITPDMIQFYESFRDGLGD